MDEIVENNASKSSRIVRQFMAALIVNLLSISFGITNGWPSPVIPLLKTENNPVSNVPLTEDEASWITALLCLGGLVTTPFLGGLIEKIGRKNFGFLACLPTSLAWLLSILASSYTWLYVSRFISGISGAMTLFLVPVYVSEIASEDVRGALGSLLVFAINIGVFLAYFLGTIMSYVAFNIFPLIFTILFLVTYTLLPETPVYLIRQNRRSQAIKSMTYFMGGDKVSANEEISRLQSQINSINSPKKSEFIRKIFCDRATRKGLIISLGLVAGQQFGGIAVMINYAQTIFKLSGSSFSPATATIIIGAIQVLGSSLSTVLMERAGRRPLVLISCGGMAVCHYIVGGFCILQENNFNVAVFSFAPVLSLSIYMIVYCLGMGPAPFVVASEVFRVDVSSTANNICFVFLWLLAFIVLKMFTIVVEIIGIGGCFLMFGSSCVFFFCFAYLLLPETKGRLREEIIDELAGNCMIDSQSQNKYNNDDKDFIVSE